MSAMGSRAARVVGALAALALALALAVAGEDARRWPERIRVDDVRFRADPTRASWRESDWAGAGAVRRLLGVEDDLRFRRVVAAYHADRLGGRPRGDPVSELQERAQLETALGAIERRDSDAQRRARAANMLGILAFETAIESPRGEQALLERTLESFRNAIAIDPREEEAKFNLELLLALLARGDLRSTSGQGGGGGTESEQGGAGVTDPGHGY